MTIKLVDYILILTFNFFIGNGIYSQDVVQKEKRLFEDLDIISFEGYNELKTLKKYKKPHFLIIKDSTGQKVKYFDKKSKKAKRSWSIYSIKGNPLIVNDGSKMPGCQYLDSSINLSNSLLVLRNCMDHLGRVKLQKVSIVKKLSKDSIRISSFHFTIPHFVLSKLIDQLVDIEEFSYNIKIEQSIILKGNKLSNLGTIFDRSGNIIQNGKREIEIIDQPLFIVLQDFY